MQIQLLYIDYQLLNDEKTEAKVTYKELLKKCKNYKHLYKSEINKD